MFQSLLLKRFLFTSLLLFCFSSIAAAQAGNNNFVLYSLSEKDGLTDNSITCFYQDSRGIMWLGSNYGLNSFDGSIIRQYHHSTDSTSIASDAVNDIKEDNAQTLWIATGSGLSSYSLKIKTFTNYYFDKTQEVLNRYYSIALLNNTVLLGTEGGLVLFDKKTRKFSLYKNTTDAASNRINKVYIDSKKRIWLCTYNGIWLFDNTTKKFTCYNSTANDALFDGLVNDIFEDHLGQLWFGTWAKGLKKLSPGTKTIESYLHFTNSATNLLSIAEQQTPLGYTLWVNSNLSKLNITTGSFNPLIQYAAEKNTLNNATRLYCDNNNLLWISTEEGVKIYNPIRQYFNTVILSGFVPLTSQGIALLPLQNKFLLGGEGGTALLVFNDSMQQLKNISKEVSLGAAVMNIQKGRQNNYWLCTSQGLIELDSALKQKKWFKHDENIPSSLPKNFLNTVLLKRNGELWVMPWRKGIWKMNVSNNSFTRVLTAKNDSLMPSGNISKAVEDEHGIIWVTDYTGGLYKYTPQSGNIENIIPSHRFTNLYISGSQLWTVGAAEIFSVDINTNDVTTILLPQGKNKYEYDFIPDGNGHLWIATKNGLLCFTTATKTFQSYTESDGLYNNIADITFARLSNGNILMAGGTYITSFSPSIALQDKTKYPILFTEAAAGGIEKITDSNHVEFNWNEKNITLQWAMLNFSNPSGNVYYYKLDGVDKDWQLAGNKGIASFNSLDPGRYIFHYKAATSDGVSSEEKTLQLIIHPPFWKTWWFILLAIAATGFLFYTVVRYISQRNLKEKVLQLEKEQAVEKERNRISRDMHDDLGSGLTKIAILTEVIKTQQQSNEHIEKISETARGLVDNLDEMVWALNPKNDSLDKLAAYIAAYAHQFLDSTGINCTVELPDEIIPLPVSEEKRRNIFMVVKEFLNNTVKHSDAANLFIALQQQNNAFTFILKDDGKGFDVSAADPLGNGVKNMQQRITDAGGQATLVSGAEGTAIYIHFG